VFADTALKGFDTLTKTRQNLFEKLCRIVGVYEKKKIGVSRT